MIDTGQVVRLIADCPPHFEASRLAIESLLKIMQGRISNQDVLSALITKAHDWFAKITSGQCAGINAIAKQENVGSSYVTRVVHLAFLDSGIIQKILQGTHSPELSADRLIRMVPLPESWVEQRKLLGMNS